MTSPSPDPVPDPARPTAPTAEHVADPTRQVALLAVGRGVANAALRWIPLFLPAIARSLDTTLGRCTAVIGVGELFGVGAMAFGPVAARHGARRLLLGGLGLVVAAGLVGGLWGTLAGFAAAYALTVLGQSACFVSGQAWIGRHVAPARRGRYLGMYESSWALALLVGAPLAALVAVLTPRAPFLLWAAIGVVVAVVAGSALTDDRPATRPATAGPPPRTTWRPPRSATVPTLIAALLMVANIAVVVVSGAWLEDDFGVSTGGLAAVAFVLGGAELAASIAVVRVGDRWGPVASIARGAVLAVAASIAVVVGAGGLAVALVVLTGFVVGFEFAFVSTLSLAVRHDPAVLAAVVGGIGAATTVTRAVAAGGAGWLYDQSGIRAVGTVAVVAFAAALGVAILAGRRPAGS